MEDVPGPERISTTLVEISEELFEMAVGSSRQSRPAREVI